MSRWKSLKYQNDVFFDSCFLALNQNSKRTAFLSVSGPLELTIWALKCLMKAIRSPTSSPSTAPEGVTDRVWRPGVGPQGELVQPTLDYSACTQNGLLLVVHDVIVMIVVEPAISQLLHIHNCSLMATSIARKFQRVYVWCRFTYHHPKEHKHGDIASPHRTWFVLGPMRQDSVRTGNGRKFEAYLRPPKSTPVCAKPVQIQKLPFT